MPLFANLGAVQLNLGVGADDCARLVDMLGADALVLHLNALQEALQAEGDTCFAGLLGRIEAVAGRAAGAGHRQGGGLGHLRRPGHARCSSAGVAAVDVAGAGGTSWSEVERHRLGGPAARTAAAFAGWGIPTSVALTQARAAAPDGVIFASGGVRSGLDVAVATALGADLVGVAGPFLRAAASGTQACIDLGREWFDVLRIAMFCTGLARPRVAARRRPPGPRGRWPGPGRGRRHAGDQPHRDHLRPSRHPGDTRRRTRMTALAPGAAARPSWRTPTRSAGRLARSHYENFTVASAVLPAELRVHLARVYAYCRVTDDLGDESRSDARLRTWRDEVVRGAHRRARARPTRSSSRCARRSTACAIPVQPFLDLISANLQDQRVSSYATWADLEAYCRLSAAPVGRMVLAVLGIRGARAEQLSDSVCIGLQLANFAQDVSVDARLGPPLPARRGRRRPRHRGRGARHVRARAGDAPGRAASSRR